MIPTEQQQSIFDAVLRGDRHVIVDASAGSGKTTTLTWLAKLLPKNSLSVFLAFNKNIAVELINRLPYWCPAKTFHAQCFAAMRLGMTPQPKVETDKTSKIFMSVCNNDKDEFFLYVPFVRKLVAYAKGQPTTEPAWEDLVDYHDMLCEGKLETGIKYAQEVFKRSNENHAIIDLDDQLYLTWLLNIPFQKVDYLFVDEAQDLNGIQHALLPRMIKDTGVITAVGDPYQSIYAFRGADSESMPKLQKQFNMLELPLSVSYRCPKAVVRSAQQIITAWLKHGKIITQTKQQTIPEEIKSCPLCGEFLDECTCQETLRAD